MKAINNTGKQQSSSPARLFSVPLAIGLLLLIMLLRSSPEDAGVPLGSSILTLGAFFLIVLLPGYAILRAFGYRYTNALDGLAPAFCASLGLLCVLFAPGYLGRWSLFLILAILLVVTASCLIFSASRWSPENKNPESFFPIQDDAGKWKTIVNVGLLLVAAQTALLCLRPLTYRADLWFHAGGAMPMVQSGFLEISDPFHAIAQPHAMYLMNSWHAIVALTALVSGTQPIDVIRIVAILMAPIAISAFAFLLKFISSDLRVRLMGLAFFTFFYSCLATSMEASPERSMWREFSGPRWVALFGIYPLTLGLGLSWICSGGWHKVLLAASLNGMAIFIHPQGGQYYCYVLLFILAGCLLCRKRILATRTVMAGLLAGTMLLPFVFCRIGLLGGVIGKDVPSRTVTMEGSEGLQISGSVPKATVAQTPGLLTRVQSSFSSAPFCRAANLLCSPVFFAGLLALPLLCSRAGKNHRLLLLLFCMGPALFLPLLPLLGFLPIRLFPNFIFRSVWAAPVLVATTMSLATILWPNTQRPSVRPEDASRTFLPRGTTGMAWVLLGTAIIVIVHLWPPLRFQRWWREESLRSLLLLAGIYPISLAIRFRDDKRRRRATVLLLALPISVMLWALIPSFQLLKKTKTTPDFVSLHESPVVKLLRSKSPGEGYLLANDRLGNQITALTGQHIVGADKHAYYGFSHQAMDMNLQHRKIFQCSDASEAFLVRLKRLNVEHILLEPQKDHLLQTKIESLPNHFQQILADHRFKLYAVNIRPAKTP